MKRMKLLGLAISAVAALSAFAFAIANASAATEMLPEGTAANPVTFTGKSKGATHLQPSGTFVPEVTCNKAEGKGSAISLKLGTFSVIFSECEESLKQKCTGLTNTTGSISTSGTFHYWLGLKGTSKVDVIVYLPTETHFECGTSLILVKGCAAGFVNPVGTLTSVTTVKLAASSKGHNEITKVINESGTEIECKLESTNSLGTEQSAQIGEQENLGYKQGGLAVTVLLMT